MSDETHPRVLYVGNLDATVTEDFLIHLFGQIGSCRGCKIIHEAASDPYAFVEFAEHNDAQMALMAMNKRNVLGRELKVNWATSPGGTVKQDTSNHYHVFVGDMSPEIDSQHLREAFAPFGEISDCKVIRDPQTNRSRGYGFISFVKKEEAEIAIASMNGQWLGGRSIRTNWANGKGNVSTKSDTQKQYKSLNYDEVFNQASATNTTVYCAGVQKDLTDTIMRQTFNMFGTVMDVRVFPEKGYAFVKMDSKEAAAKAIVETHGSEINGFVVKCSWGKEVGDAQKTPAAPGGPMGPGMAGPPGMMPGYGYGYPGYGYGYGPQMGYWGYPPMGPGGFPAGGPPMPPQQQWGGDQQQQWGQQQQQPNQQQWGQQQNEQQQPQQWGQNNDQQQCGGQQQQWPVGNGTANGGGNNSGWNN